MNYTTAFHPIEETLRSGSSRSARRVLVSGSGPRIKAILALAQEMGIPVVRLRASELDALAPGNRGVALESSSPIAEPELSLEEALGSLGSRAIILVMDHIEDPQNYGAILRSADAFGADLVVTAKNRAAPLSEAAARASAGASAHVRVAAVTNLPRALGQLAEAGFWIYAADMDGSPLPSAKLPERLAIVLGSEGSGVSRLVAECCDGSLAIPMGGHVDSLNVSVSAAIFLYEYRRQYPRL